MLLLFDSRELRVDVGSFSEVSQSLVWGIFVIFSLKSLFSLCHKSFRFRLFQCLCREGI